MTPATEPPVDRRGRARRLGSRRRTWRYLLVLVTSVLVTNALIGERGVVAMLRAAREQFHLAGSIARLQQENARLGEQARQLREEPQVIEYLARRDLGLVRSGEMLFIVTEIAEK